MPVHCLTGVRFSADKLPRLDQVGMSPTVLLFAVGLSILTAVLFGLAPAVQETRLDLHDMLKEGMHAATAGRARQRFRRILVVAQVAIAFVLLVGAGLLGRSFAALLQTDPGFASRNALTLEVSLGRRTQEQREAPARCLKRRDPLRGRDVHAQRVHGDRLREHRHILDHDASDEVLLRLGHGERVQDVHVIAGRDRSARRVRVGDIERHGAEGHRVRDRRAGRQDRDVAFATGLRAVAVFSEARTNPTYLNWA